MERHDVHKPAALPLLDIDQFAPFVALTHYLCVKPASVTHVLWRLRGTPTIGDPG